jgi:hypothetical protein
MGYDGAMRKYLLIAIALAPALAACHKADNAPGPGGVTNGEARALDEAAEMVEQRRMPAAALQTPTPGASPAPTSASASPAP